MFGDESEEFEPLPQAAAESLIQDFRIEGLYGYRTVALGSEYAATIVIAKNGSGKTTLLAALDAFLRCQFLRLRDLEFSRIVCRIRGVDRPLTLEHDDIIKLLDVVDDSELQSAARRAEIDPSDLFEFLERDFDENLSEYTGPEEGRIFSILERASRYSTVDTIEWCNRIRDSYYINNENLFSLRATISKALKDIEIVYLPTYRRIELPPIAPDTEGRPPRPPRRQFRYSGKGLFKGDVQFGLSDISRRLNELNRYITSESNLRYREISASIINELIDGTFEKELESKEEIPDPDELNLFFSRLKEERFRMGPPLDETLPNIDRIYSGEGISDESNKFLLYFLKKLNAAIQSTREIEAMVEEFITVCNKYLSQRDPTTVPPGQGRNKIGDPQFGDGKLLQLNRKNLSVHVESIALGKIIPLDSLSSGEKQMISLFAKLFLYTKDKLILIDEPELSLSINWQKQILVDLLKSPRCKQVIAITHSPFVFDNALEPYARSLKTEIDFSAIPPLESDERYLDGDDSE